MNLDYAKIKEAAQNYEKDMTSPKLRSTQWATYLAIWEPEKP